MLIRPAAAPDVPQVLPLVRAICDLHAANDPERFRVPVRGKGLPSIENRADRWFLNFSSSEVEQLIRELHGEINAKLESETLMVR